MTIRKLYSIFILQTDLISQSEPNRRGVFAKNQILPGETIFEILPSSLMITDDELKIWVG